MDPRFNESGFANYATVVAGELTSAVKSGAGKLFYLRVANTTAAKRYMFVFDNTAASGTLLCPPIPVAANDSVGLVLPGPLQFATGLTVSSSTAQASYAAGGANDLQTHAVYK